MKPSISTRHWATLNEAGTVFGMRLLVGAYRLLGRSFFSVLMYPVAMYFVLFKKEARRSSLEYLRQHYYYSPKRWRCRPHIGHTILHFKHFAEVILDKLLGWTIEINENHFQLEDPQQVATLLADPRGQLIIGSHFGNLEYCRGFMQRYQEKVINILIYDKHAANFVEIMQRENPSSRLNIFQVDEFDLTVLSILQNKIDLGEWVFIAADRVPLTGIDRTLPVQFLGRTAPLPIGPYFLAKALGCPVSLMFAYRQAMSKDTQPSTKKRRQKSHPHLYFSVIPFADKIILPRKNRQQALAEYAQQFAHHLEQHCLEAPYQWFNFYHFWVSKSAMPEDQKNH